jgi:hypothetical protein
MKPLFPAAALPAVTAALLSLLVAVPIGAQEANPALSPAELQRPPVMQNSPTAPQDANNHELSPAELQRPPAMQSSAAAPQDANEAAGLPNLQEINRPAAQANAKVEFNDPRQPSFYEKSTNGTKITEYRDRGKPVEINVESNFGTKYQMSAPADTSPTPHDNGKATRLPSVQLKY